MVAWNLTVSAVGWTLQIILCRVWETMRGRAGKIVLLQSHILRTAGRKQNVQRDHPKVRVVWSGFQALPSTRFYHVCPAPGNTCMHVLCIFALTACLTSISSGMGYTDTQDRKRRSCASGSCLVKHRRPSPPAFRPADQPGRTNVKMLVFFVVVVF